MLRQFSGAVLLTTRPAGKPFAGYWEFPGGKIETSETAEQALTRELQEEISIYAEEFHFAWTETHRYPHADVALHFYWVSQWQGIPRPLEGQQLMWITCEQAWPYPILPATVPLLEQIRNYRA